MVYVLNIQGEPLMPCKPAKARKLLNKNLAKIIKREPFTIQLLFECENEIQDITLGIDAGSKVIGVSATTDKKELFSAEIQLRNDIVDLLSTKRQNRRTRRNRLRYRQPRFNNRVKSKHKGWLAPSIENKIYNHIKLVNKIHTVLPINKIIVETASFDIQKIKNPEINGKEYQEGEQLGFWNVRQYVLHRDGHRCHGKTGCKNKILNVHHIESRKVGGDSPSNLITLCEECHNNYHNGKLNKEFERQQSFRDTAFMGIMRKTLLYRLREIYSNVSETFGYITKNARITNNLPKEHRIDAFCITGNLQAKRLDGYYYIKQVRKHNRQIHKVNILKGGKKKLNQSPYLVKGFRLFDKVEYGNQECFIFGRRATGYFDLRKLDSTIIHRSASYKKLKLIQLRNTWLTERRGVHPMTEVTGTHAII